MRTPKLVNVSLLFLSFIFLLSLASCQSTQKAYRTGDYDYAIQKSAKKLHKNNQKEKYIVLLEQSFRKANKRDLAQINLLKREHETANAGKIMQFYHQINRRQQIIQPLTPLYVSSEKRAAEFDFIAVRPEILEAKNNRSAYLYAQANKLLQTDRKAKAREAYELLSELKELFPNYKDTDALLDQALNVGTNHLALTLKNTSGMPLHPMIEMDLKRMALQNLNQTWLQFYDHSANDLPIDYDIILNIRSIDIGPEQLREKQYQEEKEITEWEYIRDRRGKIRLDSLCRKRKREVSKTIVCTINEVSQTKVGNIQASLDIFNRHNQQLVHSSPLMAESVFENQFATISGDRDALSSDSKKLCKGRLLPFPSDLNLMQDASKNLKKLAKKAIQKNRRDLLN